jgi:hypothetical protein
MAEVANLAFVDGDSGDEGFAVVRVEGQLVGLALSLRDDGDLEVFLDAKALDPLIQALRAARAMIGPSE